ncbi:hypothetical protein [Candidatus Blastococcus massiliensis]|uniref:hypothetical protein n=1 Tax=Candidatus Blastococcus massiliensis TaxID=1470358 RepID=UPI0004B38A57|nr:hypothetical protein [Candidatus Blastococcus massiliensis]
MSTEDNQPAGTAPSAPGTPSTPSTPTAAQPTPAAPQAAWPEVAGEPQEREPGWFDRNSAAVIAVSVAVIAVVAALVAVFFWRESVDEQNRDTEAAVVDFVEEQGGEVEVVECDGDTCSAVVSGQALTVLVLEDEDGDQHFGITSYVGD